MLRERKEIELDGRTFGVEIREVDGMKVTVFTVDPPFSRQVHREVYSYSQNLHGSTEGGEGDGINRTHEHDLDHNYQCRRCGRGDHDMKDGTDEEGCPFYRSEGGDDE